VEETTHGEPSLFLLFKKCTHYEGNQMEEDVTNEALRAHGEDQSEL
jgi:hypothetical protein